MVKQGRVCQIRFYCGDSPVVCQTKCIFAYQHWCVQLFQDSTVLSVHSLTREVAYHIRKSGKGIFVPGLVRVSLCDATLAVRRDVRARGRGHAACVCVSVKLVVSVVLSFSFPCVCVYCAVVQDA